MLLPGSGVGSRLQSWSPGRRAYGHSITPTARRDSLATALRAAGGAQAGAVIPASSSGKKCKKGGKAKASTAGAIPPRPALHWAHTRTVCEYYASSEQV